MTASRIARVSGAVGSRGELRIAASSRVSVTSWSMAASSARPSCAEGPALVDVAEQLRDGADGRPGGSRLRFGAGRDAESDPDERQLAIPSPEVEAKHLRHHRRERGAVGDLAA